MRIRFRFLTIFFNIFLILISGGVVETAHAQQALPKIDAEQIKKITNEASDIETLIVRATPQSITQAQAKIKDSQYLSSADKAVLDAIARGVNLAVYGQKGAHLEIPAAIEGANQKYITCLVGLVDVVSGKAPQVFEGGNCSTMSEFISSLVFFRSSKNELRNQSLAALSRFETLGSVSAVPSLIRGQLAFETKQYDESVGCFQKALELDTQSQKAACGLARVLLLLEKPETAKKALDPIVARNSVSEMLSSPQSFDFKYLYGKCLYDLNNVLDAERWFAGALKDEPTRSDVLVPLAMAAMQRRDFSTAWRYLESATKTASGDRTWLVLKSQYALENSRQSDAERFARSAVRYFPKDPMALAQLIQALKKASDTARHEEAIGLAKAVLDLTKTQNSKLVPFEEAQRIKARDVALQFLVAESYDNQDWTAAANYLQDAGSAPLDKDMVATILRKSGNVGTALQFASNWYAQDPNSEKAVEAYLRSLAMFTGGGLASAAPVSDVSSGLGIALSALGVNKAGSMNSAMLDVVVKFIAAPFSKDLKSFLYYMSASLQNDQNKAIDQLKDALVERADNVEALLSLASIYLDRYDRQSDKSDTTNRDRAARYLGQAKALNPTDNDIKARITQLESQLK